MRLTCFYNVRSDGKAGLGSGERITATYSPYTEATTIFVDADIVTIGLTAKLLQEQYDLFFAAHPEMREQVDAAINKALELGGK